MCFTAKSTFRTGDTGGLGLGTFALEHYIACGLAVCWVKHRTWETSFFNQSITTHIDAPCAECVHTLICNSWGQRAKLDWKVLLKTHTCMLDEQNDLECLCVLLHLDFSSLCLREIVQNCSSMTVPLCRLYAKLSSYFILTNAWVSE